MRISDWSSDVCSSYLEPPPILISDVQQTLARELERIAPIIDELGARFSAAGHELALVGGPVRDAMLGRSEEHTSELQSLMRISYAVFCLKKKKEPQSNRRERATTDIDSIQIGQ